MSASNRPISRLTSLAKCETLVVQGLSPRYSSRLIGFPLIVKKPNRKYLVYYLGLVFADGVRPEYPNCYRHRSDE